VTKILSFFNLGLKFSVTGDQLAVSGFKLFAPNYRPGLQESIRRHKSGIMAEVKRMKGRLNELILLADHSKGLTPDEIKAISEKGCQIMNQLSENIIQEIFK